MQIIQKSIEELVDLALKTTCINEMLFLQKNHSMNVRRALLNNRNVTSDIVTKLEVDPVENISYLASKHPKATIRRKFESVRPCVSCQKDEKGLFCKSCPEVLDHKF